MSTTVQGLATGWGVDTSDDDNLFLRFVRNQGDMSAALAIACDGRAAGTEGVVLTDTGGPVGYLNQAVLQRPINGADDPVLDQIDDFWAGEFGRANLLFSIWPTPDLARRGWSLVGHPALVARAPGAHIQARPPGVEVQEVRDTDALAKVERVVIEGYPLPEAGGRPPGDLLRVGLLDTDLRCRLGLLDGEPVASAAQFTAHGVVNLCLAATLPAARRRGVWGALVWARVDDHPELPAMAFTSDFSRPGFEHLGFLVVSRCTLWARA
ncbi:MAG: hypothetical protein ABIY48_05050 [Acidimicrobiales bacterium]